MSRTSSLAKNTFIIFIGTLCTKLVTFLLLPLYTNYLSTAEYGTLELINTIISLVVPLLYIQIDQGIFRFLIDNRNNKEDINKIVSTCFIFNVISSAIYCAIFLIICPFIKYEIKYLFFFNIIFNSFMALALQISRGLGNNIDYSISSFIIAFTTIVLNILFLAVLNQGVNALLFSLIVGYIFGTIYVVFKIKLYKMIRIDNFSITTLKKILSYSFPLVPNSLSWWVFSVSDRVVISIIIGLAATGLLSVSYKFSNAYILFYNIINMSLTESISLHINDSDINEYYNRIFSKIVNIFAWLMICFLAVLPFAFNIMINSNYSNSYGLIPIALVASLFQVAVGLLGVIYIAKNNSKAIAISSAISAIINITTDLLLVWFIGIYAAVVSTLLSFFVLLIYRIYDINKKYFTIRVENKQIIIWVLLIAVSCIVYYSYNYMIQIVYLLVVLLLFLLLNKDDIIKVLDIIKRKVIKIR